MLEIDCRTCGNCDMDRGRCKLYGDDPQKAVKACADNGFRNYCPRSSEKLINGRTLNEIKSGIRNMLEACADPCGVGEICREICCSYDGDECCHETILMGALAMIERLESERDAALAKVPRWISVEERLPEKRGTYLCNYEFKESGRIVMSCDYLGSEKWSFMQSSITHWMPQLEMPEDSPQHKGRA